MNKVSIEKLYDKKIFSIEGNMGAGKTTIINLLQKDFDDVLLVEEPVSEWQNIHGHNILEKKFENPERWCYSFESYVLISKMNALIKAAESDKKIILIERCMLSDKVFFDLAVKLGQCNPMEQEMFNNLYDFLMENVYPRLKGIIYLNTSVDECVRRIAKRNRSEETSVDKDFLQKLHNDFLNIINTTNVPTLIIDGNYDIANEIDSVREKLGNFIKKQIANKDNEDSTMGNANV